ncbi:hypothetical protein Scep_015865 [Stephania cephalantha]|uniref:Uncharacterized protein n=1 Tax=Stephania cephalantha TaxID=152367 RepID=A0AAP0J3X1_9MAGN
MPAASRELSTSFGRSRRLFGLCPRVACLGADRPQRDSSGSSDNTIGMKNNQTKQNE